MTLESMPVYTISITMFLILPDNLVNHRLSLPRV